MAEPGDDVKTEATLDSKSESDTQEKAADPEKESTKGEESPENEPKEQESLKNEPKEQESQKNEPKEQESRKKEPKEQESRESEPKDEESRENEPNEQEKKIITQIEYYFGDHNLSKDKFMIGKIKEDDGWISLSILLTFNRLKALTEDADVVVKALKMSANDIIEIHEDKSKIRRNPDKPLPVRENWKEEEWQRTAYVKGFPVDSTMDAILEFFRNEGKVSNIFMKKKFHSKSFKGSVFVTFETKEEVEAFVKKEGQKFRNTLLIKELRHDYHTRKGDEYTKRREDRDKRKLEKQEKNAEEEEKAVAAFNPEEDMKKNCLMKLTGFATGTSREDIKDKLSPHGPIAYVDFKIGEEEAVIRFEESDIAKDVLEKAQTGDDDEKKLIIKGAEITATFPEGEEEIEYWKKIIRAKSSFSKDRRNHKRRGGFQGGRGGKSFRGGRGDFRGRGRGGGRGRQERNGDSSDRKRPGPSEEGPSSAKKEKTDS